jgi:hypothetical protein
MPRNEEYIALGLTCFHVVDQSEKGLESEFLKKVREWREGGIILEDDMRKRLVIEQPSASAIEEKVISFQKEISAIEQDDMPPTYMAIPRSLRSSV